MWDAVGGRVSQREGGIESSLELTAKACPAASVGSCRTLVKKSFHSFLGSRNSRLLLLSSPQYLPWIRADPAPAPSVTVEGSAHSFSLSCSLCFWVSVCHVDAVFHRDRSRHWSPWGWTRGHEAPCQGWKSTGSFARSGYIYCLNCFYVFGHFVCMYICALRLCLLGLRDQKGGLGSSGIIDNCELHTP